jgi:hypothetical protein
MYELPAPIALPELCAEPLEAVPPVAPAVEPVAPAVEPAAPAVAPGVALGALPVALGALPVAEPLAAPPADLLAFVSMKLPDDEVALPVVPTADA